MTIRTRITLEDLEEEALEAAKRRHGSSWPAIARVFTEVEDAVLTVEAHWLSPEHTADGLPRSLYEYHLGWPTWADPKPTDRRLLRSEAKALLEHSRGVRLSRNLRCARCHEPIPDFTDGTNVCGSCADDLREEYKASQLDPATVAETEAFR